MAFPPVAASNTSKHETDVTSHVMNLDAAIAVDDLLMIFWASDGSGDVVMATTDSGALVWTKGWADELESSGHNAGLRWRIATGAEGTTATFGSTGSEQSAHAYFRIAAADIATPFLDATRAESASAQTTPDPPSHTPTGGAKDYKFFAFAAWDVNRTVSAYPTNYTDNQVSVVANTATGCGMAVATRDLNATVDDPGTFTISSAEDWSAATVAVHPGAGVVAIPSLVVARYSES